VLVKGALAGDPGRSRGQEGGGSTELFAAVSFGQSRSGAPLDPRLFSAEDANEPRTFSDLDPPSPNRVDHLTFSLSPAGTPDRLSFESPTDALSVTRSSRMVPLGIDLRIEDPTSPDR
jgi:hypothetical protein